MKVLIIEDEVLAQQELEAMLLSVAPHVEILSRIRSVGEAVAWLTAYKQAAQLIFMDIELLDGQSFEIFKQVAVEVPVIFLTAYDEFAIQAFKVNSIDYLLKPLDIASLEFALNKYKQVTQYNQHTPNEALTGLLHTLTTSYKARFTVKIGDTYRYVLAKDVAYFYADDKAAYLVTTQNRTMIVNQPLSELEPLLDPNVFFRVSRKYLVHIQSVLQASKYFNSRLKLKLSPPCSDEVLVSRVKVPAFLQWMGQ